jgi:ATP-dependent DNA ligase
MNLSDLEMECQQRGLRVVGSGKNGRVQKMDYLKALEGYTLDGLRSQGLLLPGCEWVHSHLESPMLAQAQTCFKTEALFRDFVGRSSVLAEIKNDGCRLLTSYFPGVGLEFFSRNRSVVDYLFGQYSNQVYGLTQDITRDIFPVSFVLDSELVSLNPSVNGHVVTDSVLNAVVAMLGMNQLDSFRMQAEAGFPLRFQTFDILQYDGKSVMDRPLKERKQLLHEVMVKLWEAADRLGLPQLKWFQEVETVYGSLDDKLEYYRRVVKSGGEGCFTWDSQVLMSDGSEKYIRDVCAGDSVKSYNVQTGLVEDKRVLRVFDNGLKPLSMWRQVFAEGYFRQQGGNSHNRFHNFVGTASHAVWAGSGYRELQSLSEVYVYGPVLDSYREQIILGWILSDGHISKKGCTMLGQQFDSPWFQWACRIFSGVSSVYSNINVKPSGFRSHMGTLLVWDSYFHTRKRYLSAVSGNWVQNYGSMISALDIRGVATAFMGDGFSDGRGHRTLGFSFESWSEDDIWAFQQALLGWGVYSVQRRDSRVGTGSGLSIQVHGISAHRLANLMLPFVHPSMRYKLQGYEPVEGFGSVPFEEPDAIQFGLIPCPCVVNSSLTGHGVAGRNTLRAYDLEVEGNHNYFINRVLVHNCILKDVNSLYLPHEARGGMSAGWLKMKRSVSESLGTDQDCYISGFQAGVKGSQFEGLVGSLEFSVYLVPSGEKHVIANVSGFSDELRRELSVIGPDGGVALNPRWYGRVAAVTGLDVSTRSRSFAHAKIVKWREGADAKLEYDCTMQEADLNALVL